MELNDNLFINDINAETFDDIALSVYKHQYKHNTVYRQFADIVGKSPSGVKLLDQIPFLPVSFYKTHNVVTAEWANPDLVFESSRTTSDTPARHIVKDARIYEASLFKGFREFYGSVKDYAILALLPSYLERSNASLVHMVKVLMAESGHPACGFYLDEWDKLKHIITELEVAGQRTLLIGVTFALLDFAEAYPMVMKNTIVMETGGMKGRKEEWTRVQVHAFLKQQWGINEVHSEYGMTELLSQAYAVNNGVFRPASTMKVLVRDMNDPFDVNKSGTGCLNIVDLANVHSCSFIATDDIGKIATEGSFEVLGRVDHSALRGCNLMVL